jgi:MATE family multidrug resistance protein
MAATDGKSSGELGELLRLAAPLILAHAGNQCMSVVDTAMVGRLGSAALAGVGIGNGLFFTLTVVGLGCVLGMDALVAQAVGAGEELRARRVFWQGMRVALYLGLPIAALTVMAPVVLGPVGVDPAIIYEARRYLWARMPNAVTFLLFAAARSYLQAKGSTRPILVATLLGNLLNFVGNLFLIYGDAPLLRLHLPALGLPALGVVGSGISSSIASLGMVAWVIWAIQRLPVSPGERDGARDVTIGNILEIGGPIGAQLLAEVGVFAIAGMLAGRMSPQAAAAHQIALTLASMTFTVTIGVGAAASVRVGLAIGRGDAPAARRAGTTAILLSASFMSLAMLTFFFVPRLLARFLSDDPGVVGAAIPLIMVAAVFQLSDGTQGTAAGALRGAGDTRIPLLANVVGHYAIGLPIAIGLGFGAHLGAPGLWWGLTGGLTTVAIFLTWRFLHLASRPIERV